MSKKKSYQSDVPSELQGEDPKFIALLRLMDGHRELLTDFQNRFLKLTAKQGNEELAALAAEYNFRVLAFASDFSLVMGMTNTDKKRAN